MYLVDDHYAKRNSPICLEYMRVTKYWPHCPFSFLLIVIQVDVSFVEACFLQRKDSRQQLEFMKQLVHDLESNENL